MLCCLIFFFLFCFIIKFDKTEIFNDIIFISNYLKICILLIFVIYIQILVVVMMMCSNGINGEEGNSGCQAFCPLNYDPICATDDSGETRTFSNLCVMNAENCIKKRSKHCSINFKLITNGQMG